MTIARWVPGLATLRSYKVSFLPHDLAAGVTLGAVLVPVGLAYGELAGLPMAGLYGSLLPLVAYALFGSSRQVVVGPDSAMAALVAVAILPLAVGDPGRLAMLCAALGVMTGLLCIMGGLLRLGFVANLIRDLIRYLYRDSICDFTCDCGRGLAGLAEHGLDQVGRHVHFLVQAGDE